MLFSTALSAYPRIHFTTYYLEVYLGRGGIFDCVSAYPLHNIPRSLLGEGWYFRLRIRVSAYPLHNIPRSLLGEEWYFPLCIRVSTYPLYNIPRSLLGEEWYFRLRIRVSAYPRIHFTTYYLEVYLGRGATFDCVSAYPAFSEVQLQNGGVFCSYSRVLHARDGVSRKNRFKNQINCDANSK